MTLHVLSVIAFPRWAAASVRRQHLLLEYHLGGKERAPILKEEFWQDADGRVTRYSLAYIDPQLFAGDNGRVLGYDNAHGEHHRHFKGTQTPFRFTTFRALLNKFEAEVAQLRKGNP